MKSGVRLSARARRAAIAGAGIALAVLALALVLPSGGVHVAVPTINGPEVSGQTLSVHVRSVAGHYRWQRCDGAGASCAPIPGATGERYAITGADVGHRLRVVATVTASGSTATVASLASAPVSASPCTRTLGPADLPGGSYPGGGLNSALQAAAAGGVVCLSTGDYNAGAVAGIDLYDIDPASTVTLRPAPGAIAALGTINVGVGVHNLTVTGMDLAGGVVIAGGADGNLAFVHDAFGASSVLRNTPSNAHIAFSYDTFLGISPCSSCYEGRLELVSQSDNYPDGVTISHNVFGGGGLSDGINIAGEEGGTQILDNEISGIVQSSAAGAPHSDAIQIVGQDSGDGAQVNHTVISGNYIHDNTDCFLFDDGSYDVSVTNNVCTTDDSDSSYAAQVGGGVGIGFNHNTFASTEPFGVGNDHSGNPTSGMTLTNNVLEGGFSPNPGQTVTYAAEGGNLVPRTSRPNDAVGLPGFTGGANPSSFAGFALVTGSPGKAAARDGSDIGIDASSIAPGP